MEEERINHLKQDQGELVVMDEGKRVEGPMMRDLIRLRSSFKILNTLRDEDVGLDELGEGSKEVVSKIGEFGGDIGSELLGDRGGEVLFGGGKVVKVEDYDIVSKVQEFLFCVFVSSHEEIC
ncbi:hypothetical protein Tco_1080287 [Tanacetum coccineum]|uniref:Uncharacterized protein n=1 Tax=Tanacetum coccineum TaxID=301880 RepID=A0ABQ5HUA6_9ASTR